ncbi:TrbI/VirB10 family protein [Neisseria gonorrhoeae]|uniref:TrbI/VirB10 family protein n=1 Tax=Neisseria gonorrhoeae TaxID=485 RepID=UPI0021616454|nr:TrbI/VirB10 family protein [Neisseria gonorrhoeae]
MKAQRRADSTYCWAKGTNIPCTLARKSSQTHAGITRCLVTKDVYSANGKVLLLERGTKIIGEQNSAMLHGQARVFVLWNEAETPKGVKVSLASGGAGQLGASGHGARVKYHFGSVLAARC